VEIALILEQEILALVLTDSMDLIVNKLLSVTLPIVSTDFAEVILALAEQVGKEAFVMKPIVSHALMEHVFRKTVLAFATI